MKSTTSFHYDSELHRDFYILFMFLFFTDERFTEIETSYWYRQIEKRKTA